MHKQGEGDYYLYLGLFAEHKGTHLAVEFAKKAGVKLVMVGVPDQSPYYNEKILPEYKKGNVYCYQPFNFHDKWELLARAKAVIFPSICEEGDPNVPKEALLVGTPVIALKGTVSEIVENQLTGFICKDVDEMVKAIDYVDHIYPLNCRKEVLRKFGLKKYIDDTLIALQRAIDGERWI
jgi:glycosyltransferase involved in cell wall biosynthesis